MGGPILRNRHELLMARPEIGHELAPKLIALVSMPFASTRYASLALSLLGPLARATGISTDIFYYNLEFAKTIGFQRYEALAADYKYMLGEQVFSEIRFPGRRNFAEVASFLEKHLSREEFDLLVRQADQLVEKAVTAILDGGYRLVGFTTTFLQRTASLAVAKRLRDADPRITIVMGGAGCETPMGEALIRSFNEVDAVFHGAAEHSFPAFLAEWLSEGPERPIPGVSFRSVSGAIVKGDQPGLPETVVTPAPDFDPYLASLEATGLRSRTTWFLPYEMSRGCWWGEKNHCTFCGLNGLSMRYHSKDQDTVLEELNDIAQRIGSTRIHFVDNIMHFAASERLFGRLGQIGNLQYFAELKANLKEADFVAMAGARFRWIQPGIERLSDLPLRLMRKGTTALQNVQVLRMAAEFGIQPLWNVLVGFPGEQSDDVDREVDLVRMLTHLPPPTGCAFIRVDRYSPNYTHAESHGLEILGPSNAERIMFHGVADVANLAYHFEYRWRDPPREGLVNAWSRLDLAVDSWVRRHRPGTLVVSTEGAELVVQDSRADGSEQEWVLTGAAADVYRQCLTVQPVPRLSGQYDDAEMILGQLADRGLLILQGGRALAIAVRDRAMMAGLTRATT